MGCCNNNKKDYDGTKLAMNDLTSWVLTGLINVVKTGKLPTPFKNPVADQLGVMIADLVDENKYLRAILGVLRPDTVVTGDAFTISFGPNKQYNLTIPVVTPDDRAAVIASLKDAIAKLEQEPAKKPEQLPLFQQDN